MTCGILLLDKPVGLSSNAALQRVRTLYQRIKAGHVGSLDPLASGMLPICLGEATKVAGDILAGRKCYRFTVQLGARTSTGDAEGAVVATAPVPVLEHAGLEAVLAGFRGTQRQVPPMYSALKQAGEPLYRLARAGLTVERDARVIVIDSLQLIGLAGSALELEALCSKGTYVRVLGEDIAAALGSVGHITALRRRYVEPFAEQSMHTLAELESQSGEERGRALLAPDAPLDPLPQVRLTAEATQRLLHGQRVSGAPPGAHGRLRLYDADGRFLGTGEADGSGLIQPRRLLNLADRP
jgi:tRNA pseudouridine55 synthase